VFQGITGGLDDQGNTVAPVINSVERLMTIRGGPGHDKVYLDHVRATDFLLDLAQGNDWLYLNGDNQIGGSQANTAVLRGGPNSDQIVQRNSGNVFAAPPLLSGFENLGGLTGMVVGRNGKSTRLGA